MKKRILTAVLLLICMVFSTLVVTSCGGGSDMDAFESAIENTAPTKIEGEIALYTGTAELKIEYTAEIAEDGTFTVNYSYNKLADASSGTSSDLYVPVTGTVTYDGTKYSDDSIAGKIATAAVMLDLGADMEYSVSSDGNVLTATVAAEDTEDVFGIDYAADVSFTLAQADEKIVSLALEYTLETGEVVKAECYYK